MISGTHPLQSVGNFVIHEKLCPSSGVKTGNSHVFLGRMGAKVHRAKVEGTLNIIPTELYNVISVSVTLISLKIIAILERLMTSFLSNQDQTQYLCYAYGYVYSLIWP